MSDTSDRPSNKVARLIDAYDLDGLGAELEARWTAPDEDRLSLRDLADLFNRRLLEAALDEADVPVLEYDVDSLYHDLTAEDVSAGVATDARNRLDRYGVDVDQLEGEFVSYQAIRSYLKEWRGAEYETVDDETKIRRDRDSIQRLVSRTRAVTSDRIETLRDTDRIDAAEFEVVLSVQVLCQECGRQYDLDDFLEQRGCDCQ